MIVSFTLSMPNVGSWNGKWSGEDAIYVKVINFGRSKKSLDNAKAIVDKCYYHYSFGDGWAAGVKAKDITASEARSLRAKTQGFCGYDWMVDSIKAVGRIDPDHNA